MPLTSLTSGLLLFCLAGNLQADDLMNIVPTPGCSFRFTSVQGKTGNFQSLNHPSPYPAGTVCRYNFQGQGKERVQIAFLTLDLYHPSGNASDPNDCITNSDADVIRVSIIQDGKPEEIAVLCGGVRPKTFMSSNTQLQVVFISRSIQSMATGFKANFSFVTNFGITSGQQNTDLACSFTFQSDRTSNGTFTSPNFPGLYPRSTDCHYLFYGETNQRVYIKFTYFEVDGIRPGCTDSTHSDYVELSNFDAITDRKMERLCSADLPEKERSVLSDRSFFRVTFHSNSKYDLTGFSAFYQFRTYDDASSQRRHEELVDLKLNSAASSSAPSSLPLSLPMSLAILLSPVACLYAPVATLIIYP